MHGPLFAGCMRQEGEESEPGRRIGIRDRPWKSRQPKSGTAHGHVEAVEVKGLYKTLPCENLRQITINLIQTPSEESGRCTPSSPRTMCWCGSII